LFLRSHILAKKITLPALEPRDVGRILSGLRERRKRLTRGITKFGDDFDPDKGRNMTDALEAYETLITLIEGATE
jgi:hypothetical protein